MMDVALTSTGKTAPLPIHLASEADDLAKSRHIGTSGHLIRSFSGVRSDHRAAPGHRFAMAATGDGLGHSGLINTAQRPLGVRPRNQERFLILPPFCELIA
jgi:hypothetical protein